MQSLVLTIYTTQTQTQPATSTATHTHSHTATHPHAHTHTHQPTRIGTHTHKATQPHHTHPSTPHTHIPSYFEIPESLQHDCLAGLLDLSSENVLIQGDVQLCVDAV